jgi:hypothetical protein
MNLALWVIYGFACFRLTHLIVRDDITMFLRAPFVEEEMSLDRDGHVIKLQIPRTDSLWRGYIGVLLSCPWCTSIWAAILLVLGWYLAPRGVLPVVLVLALSGLAMAVEVVTRFLSGRTYRPTEAHIARLKGAREALLSGRRQQPEPHGPNTSAEDSPA